MQKLIPLFAPGVGQTVTMSLYAWPAARSSAFFIFCLSASFNCIYNIRLSEQDFIKKKKIVTDLYRHKT